MSKWEFEFEAAKPFRLHRYFWSATIMDGKEPDLWWCDHFDKFLPHDHPDLKRHSHGNHSKKIRTFRSFKRFLRKHVELQGREVLLVNRYIGFNVRANYR